MKFISDYGIIHQLSCSYTLEHSGVAEWKNQHMLEVVRSMLLHTDVPKEYLGDAVLTAYYLNNRMPSTILGVTKCNTIPLGVNLSLPPHIFDFAAFVHQNSPCFDGLDPRATKCIFIG